MRNHFNALMFCLIACSGVSQESPITFLEFFPGYKFKEGELRCIQGTNECQVISKPEYNVFVNEDLVVCRVGCDIDSDKWEAVLQELESLYGSATTIEQIDKYGIQVEMIKWSNQDKGYLLLLSRHLKSDGTFDVSFDWSHYMNCR